MGDGATVVPHSKWEVAFWTCLVVSSVVRIATASGGADLFLGIGLLVLTVWFCGTSIRLHRSRPDILARSAPSGVLWLLGFAAVTLAAMAASGSNAADRVADGLLACSAVFAIVVERTRKVPRDAVITGETGGYFDPMTAGGQQHRRRAIEAMFALVIVVLGVIGIAGDEAAAFYAGAALLALVTFEVLNWLEKRFGLFKSLRPPLDAEPDRSPSTDRMRKRT
jgi:hypothetical protein